jgi:hypothetical protein
LLLPAHATPGVAVRRTATFRSIILHDGLRGLYRGLGPTILGYLPTWAIYFAVYDGIKTRFGELPLGIDTLVAKSERLYPAPSAKGYQPIVREHPWSLHILSAMAAGATQHYLYQSPLGHQNPLHGAFFFHSRLSQPLPVSPPSGPRPPG